LVLGTYLEGFVDPICYECIEDYSENQEGKEEEHCID